MITDHISIILYVTGAITASALLQFLAPRPYLRILNRIEVGGSAELFFSAHWGLVATTFGLLLLYAAGHAEVRGPIVFAAMAEKLAFASLIWLNVRGPTRGLVLTGVFDSVCVLLYGSYLLGIA
ncbi:MAG: hypothetical protein K1X75_07375 [Leptospirales bacterium]|nr:hypothetical protein [Leptospirales bacterium]